MIKVNGLINSFLARFNNRLDMQSYPKLDLFLRLLTMRIISLSSTSINLHRLLVGEVR